MGSNKAKNALGGVATGASMGMALGPIGGVVGGALGGLAGLFSGGGDDTQAQLEQARQYLSQANPQALQRSNYTPDQYSYQTVADSPDLMAAQKNYLQQLSGLSQSGLAPEDAATLENMRQAASQQSRGSREAALTSAQARGVGGGGLEFLMGEQGAQGAQQAARQNAFQQAEQVARQRALYNTAYGQALTANRQQNFMNNQTNTDIMNNYSKANTDLFNNAKMYNQQYNNQVTQQNNQNKLGWAQGMAGQTNTNAGYSAAQDAANQQNLNSSLGGLASAYTGYQTQQYNQDAANKQQDQRQQLLDYMTGTNNSQKKDWFGF